MIKSILSGSPVRKFVAYSNAQALNYKFLNDKYPTFQAIPLIEDYPAIVKEVLPYLSEEEQASIVEILKGYNSRGQYSNLKTSIPLEAALIEMLRQKEEQRKLFESDRRSSNKTDRRRIPDRRKYDRRKSI